MTTAIRKQKEERVQQLADLLSQALGVILVDFRGLTVAESNELRRQLREDGVEFRVVKNSLATRAVSQLGFEDVEGVFVGPTAMAIAQKDPAAAAKTLTRFMNQYHKVEVKGGFLGTTFIRAEEVEELAKLPSREELLAKVMGGAAAPLYGFVGALNGLLRNVVYALDALRRQREAA